MALDKEFFENIHIDVAKKKYYNANKVEAVMEEIRRQAEELNAENARLKEQLARQGDRREEVGETILSAQAIYRDIIEKANTRADQILSEAEARSARLDEETQNRQEESVRKVNAMLEKIKQQHLDAVEAINAAWQEFLCALYPEDQLPAPAGDDAAEAEAASAPATGVSPADLEQKVGAIAKQLQNWDD